MTEAEWRKGVGAFILSRDNQLFIAERYTLPGAWQMPQGGIDKSETPLEAVCRELEEETGTAQYQLIQESTEWLYYLFPLDVRETIWDGRYKGQMQRWFAFYFTGRDEDINLSFHHPQEFIRWRWLPPEELPTIAVPFKRDLYTKVLHTFRSLIG